jgi:prepilin-type N-terminal cleavage/methylation domain-containing protein
MSARRGGFTFIEILACLLVVSVGMAAAVSLTYSAIITGNRAQAKATAMATALTVTVDPAPLMHQGSAQWTTASATGVGTTSGWINGFYVVRVETQGSSPITGFTSDPVSVDVYDNLRGNLVASFTTRLLHQDNSP